MGNKAIGGFLGSRVEETCLALICPGILFSTRTPPSDEISKKEEIEKLTCQDPGCEVIG